MARNDIRTHARKCHHKLDSPSVHVQDHEVLNYRTPFALQVGLKVPLIVRLEGTNVEKGKEILKTSEHTIIPADDLDDAAHKAVKSIS